MSNADHPAVPSPAGEAPTRCGCTETVFDESHHGHPRDCPYLSRRFPASTPPAAAPTQPPRDTQRLDWLDEVGVETILLRDGTQIEPGSLNVRTAIDLHHQEAIYDAID